MSEYSLHHSLGDPAERLLSRKIGAHIICHLSRVFPSPVYVKSYIPYVQKLAVDANWEVRKVVASDLPGVCENLGGELSGTLIFEPVCDLRVTFPRSCSNWLMTHSTMFRWRRLSP